MELSIITPTFNRQALLLESVRSSLRFLEEVRSYASGVRGEIVIVDDASTDDTALTVRDTFARELADGQIRFLSLPSNVGVTGAKNAGARAAAGEWLIFMDSDDQFVPGAGAAVWDALTNALDRVAMVQFRCVDMADGRLIGAEADSIRDYSARTIHSDWINAECLPVARRQAALACPYDEDLRGFEFLAVARMARDVGDIRLHPVVARAYRADETGDRLSARKNIGRRGCMIARGYVRLLREFWPSLAARAPGILARIALHSARCLRVRFRG